MKIELALERASNWKVADAAPADRDSSRTTPTTEDPASTCVHSEGTPPMPSSTETTDDPPSLPSPTDPTDPALAPTPVVLGAGGATPSMPNVKLPKLSIKIFKGDLMKWVTFWDSFDSSIHRNLSLSSVNKFNYLNSLLELTTAESIARLTLTPANYKKRLWPL